MQFSHYVTIFFGAVNISLLALLFLRYFRFRKKRIPALNYCLWFFVTGLVYSLCMVQSFLLPAGGLLEYSIVTAALASVFANVFFALTVINMTGVGGRFFSRFGKLAFLLPLGASVFYLTNGWHHLVVESVWKEPGGFLFGFRVGVLGKAFYAYAGLLTLISIVFIFISERKGAIKNPRVRWYLLFSSLISPALNFLESTIPLLAEVRFSLFFVWLPVALVTSVCFGYLLSARNRAVQIMGDAYVVFDLRGFCVDINHEGAAFFQEHCGTEHPRAEDLKKLVEADEEPPYDDLEFSLPAKGRKKYYRVRCFRLSDTVNQYSGNGYVISEITEFVQKMTRLDSLASEDPLTGAKNRRYFRAWGDSIIDRALEAGKPVTALMLDLDFFKRVNDHFGHAAGDEVLKMFCQVCRRNLREGDLLFRFGGEEFVIICEGTGSRDGRRMAERIRRAVETHVFTTSAGDVTLTVSIGGYTRVPAPGDDLAQYVKIADTNLYKAKDRGRNWVEYTHDDVPEDN